VSSLGESSDHIKAAGSLASAPRSALGPATVVVTHPRVRLRLPMTLTLRALHFRPRLTFAVLDEERQVAEVKLTYWRKDGMLDVEGDSYSAYRIAGRERVLERSAVILARATEPSPGKNIFIIKYEGQEYCLIGNEGWPIVIRSAEQKVASLAIDGPCTFPATWPLHLSVFVIWLALVLYREQLESYGA
jgi:hypothetical protein